MWTKAFWKATGERALKTGAQVAASFFVIGTTGLIEIDWVSVGSVSGAAVLASLLTSVASHGVTKDGPSLTHAETIE